ncbi:MAG: glycerol kinase [Gammaproteobacteria bacterium]|nr:MAG: glycerol kinase [Gammaproteobacteria bacterium]
MPKSLILAIDQGGQSSRVAVYTQAGEQLYCFSAACSTSQIFVNGVEHIEQNPQDILNGIKDCLKKISLALGDDVKHIVAAGFAGQGSSLLCWNNQTGEALSPVLSWQDTRGENYLKDISLAHEQAQLVTGLRVSPHYGASKIKWCLENNNKVITAYKNNSLSIGPIVSYVFWHLTGKNLVDPGHAQRTLLWNLKENNWDSFLLNLFSIPQEVLPECEFHNSYFGDVEIGKHRVPFKASARDQGASLFARGIPDKNTCYINIGTGAFVQRVSENLQAPEGLLVSPLWLPGKIQTAFLKAEATMKVSSSPCYLDDFFAVENKETTFPQKLYAWEATVNGAASAIGFLQQQTAVKITPVDIESALQLNPIKSCYFLNAIGGLSAPYWRTDLQSQFSENLSAPEKILAWLESVVFQIVVNVTLMNKLGPAEKIYISGGLSNSNAICQKIADLTSIAVHRSDNADATLQGIACMAAGISTEWQFVGEEQVFKPESNAKLNKRFLVWQDAMKKWLG